MSNESNIETLKAAWDALGRGDWDALTAAYTDDMIFVIPGQTDIISGKPEFRTALESIAEALPPGFDITDLRYFAGEADGEVVNIVEWTSAKIPEGTQSAVLWKFDAAGRITEERWYVDTEQWKAAF
jgi:ketosteroid isomerase-like protein